MRLWDDPARLTRVRWFRCDPLAITYTDRTPFRSRNWSDPKDNSGLGEQYPGSRPYDKGANSAGYLGLNFCGTADVFQRGGIVGTTPEITTSPDGTAACCFMVNQLATGGVVLETANLYIDAEELDGVVDGGEEPALVIGPGRAGTVALAIAGTADQIRGPIQEAEGGPYLNASAVQAGPLQRAAGGVVLSISTSYGVTVGGAIGAEPLVVGGADLSTNVVLAGAVATGGVVVGLPLAPAVVLDQGGLQVQGPLQVMTGGVLAGLPRAGQVVLDQGAVQLPGAVQLATGGVLAGLPRAGQVVINATALQEAWPSQIATGGVVVGLPLAGEIAIGGTAYQVRGPWQLSSTASGPVLDVSDPGELVADGIAYQVRGPWQLSDREESLVVSLSSPGWFTIDEVAPQLKGPFQVATSGVVLDTLTVQHPPNLFVATFAGNGQVGTTVVINKPTGVVAGDLLVAFIWCKGTAVTSLTAPARWHLITTGTSTNAGTKIYGFCYYYNATGSDPATWSWSINGTGADLAGEVFRVSFSAGLGTSSSNTGNAGPAVASGITVSVKSAVLIGFGALGNNTFSTPAGTTATTLFKPPNNTLACEGFSKSGLSAGGTGNFSSNISVSNPWVAFAVEVKQ